MKKETARDIIKWIVNTNLDADTISDYYGLKRKDKQAVRDMLPALRKERDEKWARKQQNKK